VCRVHRTPPAVERPQSRSPSRDRVGRQVAMHLPRHRRVPGLKGSEESRSRLMAHLFHTAQRRCETVAPLPRAVQAWVCQVTACMSEMTQSSHVFAQSIPCRQGPVHGRLIECQAGGPCVARSRGRLQYRRPVERSPSRRNRQPIAPRADANQSLGGDSLAFGELAEEGARAPVIPHWRIGITCAADVPSGDGAPVSASRDRRVLPGVATDRIGPFLGPKRGPSWHAPCT
jgi:hypothetical protein